MAASLMRASEFHPEFYFTVATVLPLFLLVSSLVAVFLGRWPTIAITYRPTPQEQEELLSLSAEVERLRREIKALPGSVRELEEVPGPVREPPGTVTLRTGTLWPRALAVTMACINVAAETTCLIVLFIWRSYTVTSVIIWTGLACTLAWTLLLLITYIVTTVESQTKKNVIPLSPEKPDE
jgi:hypothetical protein